MFRASVSRRNFPLTPGSPNRKSVPLFRSRNIAPVRSTFHPTLELDALLPAYDSPKRQYRKETKNYSELAAHMEAVFRSLSVGTDPVSTFGENAEPETLPPLIVVIGENAIPQKENRTTVDAKENVMLRSLLGIVDRFGTFVIPMSEWYRENLGQIMKLGFVRLLDFEARGQDYSGAMAAAIGIVHQILRQAHETALGDPERILGLDYMERSDSRKYKVKFCAFNHPSIIV